MEHLLNNHKNPEHHEYIKAAFGPNYDVDQIKKNVAMMKGDDAIVPIVSRFPDEDRPHTVAFTHMNIDKDTGKAIIDSETGRSTGFAVELGPKFMKPGRTAYDDANALMHEEIHNAAGGSDHIIKPGVVGNENHVVYQDHLPSKLRHRQSQGSR